HAKLFETDFGRWPANVAELEGYVDFDSHPDLLSLRPKEDSFAAGFVSMFTTHTTKVRREEGQDLIDDGLYVIEGDGGDWCLRFRNDQFKQQKTICIDAKGEIHRVSKEHED